MKIRLSTRLWLAWQVLRGRIVEASFNTLPPERTVIVLSGLEGFRRVTGGGW